MGMAPDNKPRGNALYLADEDFRDVTYEMEDGEDLYNGAIVEWRIPERKRKTAELSAGVSRRATASGKQAMRTPGVMAAIAAKKEADAKKAQETLEKEKEAGNAEAIAAAEAKIKH